MKRTKLLSSAAAPLAVRSPLTIGVAMTDAATARVTIGGESFVLPDDRAAMTTVLAGMPGKDRRVVLSVTGGIAAPYRVVAGLIHLVQAAGFARVSVVGTPPAD